MPFKTIKEKFSSIKNPFSKKDKDNSNITGSATNQNKSNGVTPVKNRNGQQQVKEAKTKESNKEKFANGIATALKNALKKKSSGVKVVINEIAEAVTIVPPNCSNLKYEIKKYGFISTNGDILKSLGDITKGPVPKNDDTSTHHFYHIRKALLNALSEIKKANLTKPYFAVCIKNLKHTFNNAKQAAGNYRFTPPLIAISDLNTTLGECASYFANCKYIQEISDISDLTSNKTSQIILNNLEKKHELTIKNFSLISEKIGTISTVTNKLVPLMDGMYNNIANELDYIKRQIEMESDKITKDINKNFEQNMAKINGQLILAKQATGQSTDQLKSLNNNFEKIIELNTTLAKEVLELKKEFEDYAYEKD